MPNQDKFQGGKQSGGGSGSQQSGGKNQGYSGPFEDSRMDPNHADYDPNWKPGPVGAVEDPENDGRLKENREEGKTKGTTYHSSQAPHVDRDNSGSINNPDRSSSISGNDQGGSKR